MTAILMRVACPIALLLSASFSAAAAPPASLAIECAPRALPSQGEVGAFLGLHNQDQVYAARARLMAQAARACNAEGTRLVQLVRQDRPQAAEAASSGLARVGSATP